MPSPGREPAAQLLVFALDRQSYALDLCRVRRVLRAVEITPLPKAPEIVLGVINVRGEVIPVVDLKRRFHLPGRPLEPEDRLIVARTARRALALVADGISGVIELPASDVIRPESILPDLEYLRGVVKLGGGMIFIHDLEQFLSLEEENQLDDALHAHV